VYVIKGSEYIDHTQDTNDASGHWWPHTIQFYYFDDNAFVTAKRSRMINFVERFLQNYLKSSALTGDELTIVPFGISLVPKDMHREWIKTQTMFYYQHLMEAFHVLRRAGDLEGPQPDGLYTLQWSLNPEIRDNIRGSCQIYACNASQVYES
jgi:hypothetical protein